MPISYAQNLEDIMLWRALKDVENGFYIDVGAWSPDVDSVTKLFYENGWRGINIEPNAQMLDVLNSRRLRDINLGIALSDVEGRATLKMIGDTGLSTLDHQAALKFSEEFDVTESSVEVSTLSKVWQDHVPENQQVHFLKIDVEGLEEQVIRGADWERHRPWLIVVEATVARSQVQNHHGWEPLLLDTGYNFVWFDGLNRYYLCDEKAELSIAFASPPNVFDEYELYSHAHLNSKFQELIGQLENSKRSRLDLESELMQASLQIGSLRDKIELLQAEKLELSLRFEKMEAELEWSRSSVLFRIFFDKDCYPRESLKRALFGRAGHIRKMTRNFVVGQNNLPRKIFQRWLWSQDYSSLPNAEIFYPMKTSAEQKLAVSQTGLHTHQRLMLQRLLHRLSR